MQSKDRYDFLSNSLVSLFLTKINTAKKLLSGSLYENAHISTSHNTLKKGEYYLVLKSLSMRFNIETIFLNVKIFYDRLTDGVY